MPLGMIQPRAPAAGIGVKQRPYLLGYRYPGRYGQTLERAAAVVSPENFKVEGEG